MVKVPDKNPLENYDSLHDKTVTEICESLRDKGFIVTRLDNRCYPDILITRYEKPIPLEIQIGSPLPKIRQIIRLAHLRNNFNETLVISFPKSTTTKQIPKRVIAYLISKELRKRKYSYKSIRHIIEANLALKISKSTLSDWLNNRNKPTGYNKYLLTFKVSTK